MKESNNSSNKKEVDIREVFYGYFFIKYFFGYNETKSMICS